MKIIYFLLITFIGITISKAQTFNENIQQVNSIEEATNITLKDIKGITKSEKVIISYEYLYNLDSINLSDYTFVRKYEYDLNNLKRNESLFLLKILIDIDTEIYLTPILFKATKHKKNNIELTNITIQTDNFMVEVKKE